MVVSYETVRRWCDKFGASFAHRVKAVRRKPGSTWHLDEMFVTLGGEPYLLWRAVDEHGAELDILLQKRRDKAAAKRFFQRVLRSHPVPRKILTDQLGSYQAAKADIPELTNVKHVLVKAGARVNNRAGLSRPRSYTRFSHELRPDPAALRPGPASAARFALSQTSRSSIHGLAEFTEVTQNPSAVF